MALVYTPECAAPSAAPTSFDDFLNVLDNLNLGGPTLVIDCDRKRVQRNQVTLKLTRKEYELLEYLALNPDTAVSRDELINTIWAHQNLGSDSRTVDITIRRLRTKLGDPELVSTVRGQGYRFNSSTSVAVRAVSRQLSRHALAA